MKKRRPAEEIVTMVREAENGLAKDKSVEEVCRKLNVSPATLVRWRHRYGGLKDAGSQAVEGIGAGEWAAQEAGGSVGAGTTGHDETHLPQRENGVTP